jgi:hypothetical protein
VVGGLAEWVSGMGKSPEWRSGFKNHRLGESAYNPLILGLLVPFRAFRCFCLNFDR